MITYYGFQPKRWYAYTYAKQCKYLQRRYLADKLTLFKEGIVDLGLLLLLAIPTFQTFRRPCTEEKNMCIYWLFKCVLLCAGSGMSEGGADFGPTLTRPSPRFSDLPTSLTGLHTYYIHTYNLMGWEFGKNLNWEFVRTCSEHLVAWCGYEGIKKSLRGFSNMTWLEWHDTRSFTTYSRIEIS